MNKYMKIAIDEAMEGIRNKEGGPFGSCIVKGDRVIASAHNQVLLNHDASCHGEINAIRKAGEILGTHDLSGCEIYTTGEPCPMCLCACMWANIDKVYYGCSIKDNAKIGFRDERFSEMMQDRAARDGFEEEVDREECLKLFEEYNEMEKENY